MVAEKALTEKKPKTEKVSLLQEQCCHCRQQEKEGGQEGLGDLQDLHILRSSNRCTRILVSLAKPTTSDELVYAAHTFFRKNGFRYIHI